MQKINRNGTTDFEHFFNIAIDLLCISDHDGNFLELNLEWEKALGFKLDDLYGRNFTDFTHPDDMASTMEAFESIREGKFISGFENRFLCADGGYRWFEWRAQPVGDHFYAAANDITERKFFEKEVADTLKFNSKIFYTSPIGIATYTQLGECKSCNIAYADLFGENVQNILMYSIGDLDSQFSLGIAGLWENVFNTGIEIKKELHFLGSAGKEMWLDCNINLFNSNDKNFILVLLQNISEKKRNEKLIIESERRFRGMLSNVKLLSVILDKNGNIRFVNDFALATVEYERSEIEGKSIFDLFFLSEAENFNRLTAAGKFPEFLELELFTKSGQKRIIKWSNTALMDESKNFAGLACIGEDITDFKLYEKILSFRYELIEMENEKGLSELIQFTLDTAEEMTNSKIGFFHFFAEDENKYIIQAGSTNTMKMSNMPVTAGMKFDLKDAGIWSDSIKERKPVIHNNYSESPNKKGLPPGHVQVTRDLIFPIIKDNKIVAVVGVGNKDHDYTQRDIEIISLLSDSMWNILYKKRTTEALKKSEEQLRALNLTKDKFFSIIAHDLKSPFQGMLGSLQILSSEYDYISNEDRKSLVASIDRLSKYTYRLLENLLQWSRIQIEQLEYNVQIFNPRNAFAETVDFLSNIAYAKNIVISQKIPDTIFVKADLNVVITVFRNLLSNAVKFTNKNGEINIYAEEDGDYIKISVQDNGIGMTDGEIQNLFLIEKQQHRKGTEGESGTGLGLIICKEMVEKSGGSIFVNSTPGKGTTFTFTLPKVS